MDCGYRTAKPAVFAKDSDPRILNLAEKARNGFDRILSLRIKHLMKADPALLAGEKP
jgi:hypothetical protein